MHASNNYLDNGRRVTKIAIVTALHLGVALALINMKVITEKMAAAPPLITKPIPEKVITPEPIEKMVTKTIVPQIYVPELLPFDSRTPDAVSTTTLQPPRNPPETVGPAIVAAVPVAEPVKAIARPVYTPTTAGNCAVPAYPPASLRNGDSGTVSLALLIGADGAVAQSRIARTSGFRELDRAAVAALSMCKFKPANTNGVPEAAWGQIAYVWNLDQ